MSTNIQGKRMGPPVETKRLEVEEELHQGEEDQEEEFVLHQYDNASSLVSSNESNLRTHLKAHSGEKLNKCNQCDYACSDPSGLRIHLKIHSGEKSKECNQCDFGEKRKHMYSPIGE